MKKIILKMIVVILTVIILMQANIYIVLAKTTSELQDEQSQTNSKINETKKELEEVQEQKSTTLKQVEELTAQIVDYENQIAELDGQISELNTKISEAQEKINQAEKDYEEREKLMETRLIEIQENGETSYIDFLLTESDNLIDFISNYYFVKELVNADTDFLDSIKKQKEEIEEAKANLETSKKELDTAKAQKQGVSTQLKAAKNEKDQQVEKLSEDEKQLQAEIEELKRHEQSISSQIQKIKEEYDKQQRNTASSSYGFGWPVSNSRIGTGYGVSGRYWSSGYHTGVDFPVGAGTPVFAVGDGQVCDTGYNSAYGNFVEIYHGNNVYSFYAHASSVGIRNGQEVKKGQQIMLSGATGNVTGAHLHFEIRTPGSGYSSCVNPMNYLP